MERHDKFQYPPHGAKTQQCADKPGTANCAHGSSERTRAAETQRPLPYLICTRQTKNQYEKAIKPSMNRTENQFSKLNSACVFGPPLKLRAPQASQYPS